MKKIFALFCAVFLMPTFSAQAWIGGPFSSNAFFGETGADGVYEATASAVNGLGLYRIVVGNDFDGVAANQVQFSGDQQTTVTPVGVGAGGGGAAAGTGRPIDYIQIKSGNAVIGAFGSSWTNVWFFEGISYYGRTLGTANFASGTVVATAEAYSVNVVNPTLPLPLTTDPPQDLTPNAFLSSMFRAQVKSSGKLIAARTFAGRGQGRVRFSDRTRQGLATPDPINFRFTVFGSKASDAVLLGL
jgi:hypothetical protein